MPQTNINATQAPQTREQTFAPDSHDAPIGGSHSNNRTGWLRAAVFGANGVLLSITSLMAGVPGTLGSSGDTTLDFRGRYTR